MSPVSKSGCSHALERDEVRLNNSGAPVRDKYRRQIARLILDGTDVADILIPEGHAEPYDGGARRDWCGP